MCGFCGIVLPDGSSRRLDAPLIERMRDVLAEPFQARRNRVSAVARAGRARLLATIDLYLGLNTWRSLAGGLSPPDCVDAAVRAVMAQA